MIVNANSKDFKIYFNEKLNECVLLILGNLLKIIVIKRLQFSGICYVCATRIDVKIGKKVAPGRAGLFNTVFPKVCAHIILVCNENKTFRFYTYTLNYV